MSVNHVHGGKKSWWDGSVTTFCGITWTKHQGKARKVQALFPRITCPACRAAKKEGKR